MKLLITGATGLVGKKLTRELLSKGHEVVVTTRSKDRFEGRFPYPAEAVEWDGQSEFPVSSLSGVDGVIHLLGEPIAAKRWSEEQKKRLYDSRVVSTRKLCEAIKKASGVKFFVSSSAIGYYGDQGDDILAESAKPSSDFMGKICRDWEAEVSNSLDSSSVRTLILRIGIVLSADGGMLDKVVPIFRNGVGGRLGSGKQWMSWVHIDDLVGMFVAGIENDWRGVVNAVAPHPVTNQFFTQTLSKVLGRPAPFPAPGFALKIALGEMSTLLLGSTRVAAKRASELGYDFHYSKLEEALKDVLGTQGDSRFYSEQWLPNKPEEVFEFFSSETNLEEITPKFLEFKVLKKSTPKIQKGTLLDYRLKLRGFPIKWRTEICTWDPIKSFTDQQLRGPYSKWYHTHKFYPMKGGTLMTDEVHYKVPLGWLGQLFAGPFVKRDVTQIFGYRKTKMNELFKPGS